MTQLKNRIERLAAKLGRHALAQDDAGVIVYQEDDDLAALGASLPPLPWGRGRIFLPENERGDRHDES